MATMHRILVLILASLYSTTAHLEARQDDIPPFQFNPVSQTLFTCSRAVFTWLYDGPQTPVFLTLSTANASFVDPSTSSTPQSTSSLSIRPNNVGPGGAVPRALPTGRFVRAVPAGALLPPPISIAINQNGTSANDQLFVLSSVTVPEGVYIITASLPSLNNLKFSSDPFQVLTGPDTSCVQPLPSSSSSLGSTSTSASSVSSSTSIPLPVGGSSMTKSNSGAIAGGVIGGIAALGIVVGLLLYLYSSRRKPTKSRAVGDSHVAKGWGGLGSVDETHYASDRESKASPTSPTGPGFASTTKRDKHTSQPDSLIAISGLSSIATSPSPSPLPAHYAEATTPEPSSYASTYGASPLAATPFIDSEHTSPTMYTGFTSHKSPFDSSSSNEDIPSTSPSAYAGPGAYEMKRRPSTSSAASTTPTSGTHGRKRTPRKPVPVYTPSSSPPPPTSPPPTSPSVSSPRSPPPAAFDHDEELEERARGVLAHKNSFGLLGGEVHYLIPDMPVGAPQGK